jgi:hypothetical protein
MSMILQNLRSVTPGVVPGSLAPGQLCFNVADDIMFIGDGSGYQTSFDGTQTPTAAGEGWFSIPLSLPGLSQFFLQNPASYSPEPQNGEVLVYSASLGKPVWETSPGTPTAYTTTNLAVESAPGVSTSAKISNALGVTPIEADSVIVSGAPGDTYQGFYQFISGNWTYAAGYADPTALQVPYSNTLSGLIATTVQAALDELAFSKLEKAVNTPSEGQVLSWSIAGPLWVNEADIYPTAAQVSYNNTVSGIPATNVQDALSLTWERATDALQEADSAQDDATAAQETANIALNNSNSALVNSVNAMNDAAAALNVANAALPRAGGTMTGDISFNDGQPVDAGTF